MRYIQLHIPTRLCSAPGQPCSGCPDQSRCGQIAFYKGGERIFVSAHAKERDPSKVLILVTLGPGKYQLAHPQVGVKLHLITRGDTVFAQGAADVGRFDEVLRMILWHIERYNALGEDDIHHLIERMNPVVDPIEKDDTLVYGPNGNRITARTRNQQRLVTPSAKTIWSSPSAGTGKTYTAVAMAVAAFKDKRVKKIIPTYKLKPAKTSVSCPAT